MAAILDKNHALDLNSLAEGLSKYLPSYAKPVFIRALSHVEMTGILFYFRNSSHLYMQIHSINLNLKHLFTIHVE